MKEKKSLLRYLIFGNKLVIISVFFTMATVTDVVLCTILGHETATTHVHLFNRLMVCAIGALPLGLFKYFEKLSMWAIFPIHYIVSSGLVMLYVYICGFFETLHPDAYRDMFRSVAIMYAIIVIGALIIDLTRTAGANKDLKKIQSSPPS